MDRELIKVTMKFLKENNAYVCFRHNFTARNSLVKRAEKVRDIIYFAFEWEDTSQGNDFWYHLWRKAKRKYG